MTMFDTDDGDGEEIDRIDPVVGEEPQPVDDLDEAEAAFEARYRELFGATEF